MEEPMRWEGPSAVVALFAAMGLAAAQPASDITPGTALEPGHFVTTFRPHQWRASKLIGLDVYGTEDEKVGDVIEVLIDMDGNEVVVIGVGGFLGIARREVAVPFKAVDWRYGEPPKPRKAEASTGPSSTGPADASRRTVDTSRRGYPDHAFVRTTKEALKAAPEFKFGSDEPNSISKSTTPAR
jgi:sporulation protein YlmC with PRC-barrel domain